MTAAIQTHKMMLHKMKHSIQYEMLFVELEEFVKSFGDCQCNVYDKLCQTQVMDFTLDVKVCILMLQTVKKLC